MSKPKMLNVRKHLEYEIWTIDWMLERNGKHGPSGLNLPPIDVKNLMEIRFFARAILRKHESKSTRKDVYVERRSD
jgi:hypothetical protein